MPAVAQKEALRMAAGEGGEAGLGAEGGVKLIDKASVHVSGADEGHDEVAVTFNHHEALEFGGIFGDEGDVAVEPLAPVIGHGGVRDPVVEFGGRVAAGGTDADGVGEDLAGLEGVGAAEGADGWGHSGGAKKF